MRHFFSNRIWLVLVLALVLTIIVVLVGNLTGNSFCTRAVQTVLAPLRAGANTLTDHAQQLFNYMYRYEALEAENEALKKQLAQMEENNRLADSIKRENERLNDLLGFKKNNENYQLVDSYVIGRSSTDWVSSITLDKGTSAGIATGMVAITANGEVVGVVTEVGKNYAVVKTVLDASLEISAAIAASGYSGMVRGGYTSGQKDLLRMNYLPSSAVIRNRDQVVTAGSAVFPRNLILGYVVDAGLGDTGVAKFAYLEPAADIDNLEQVFIVTEYGQE